MSRGGGGTLFVGSLVLLAAIGQLVLQGTAHREVVQRELTLAATGLFISSVGLFLIATAERGLDRGSRIGLGLMALGTLLGAAVVSLINSAVADESLISAVSFMLIWSAAAASIAYLVGTLVAGGNLFNRGGRWRLVGGFQLLAGLLMGLAILFRGLDPRGPTPLIGLFAECVLVIGFASLGLAALFEEVDRRVGDP